LNGISENYFTLSKQKFTYGTDFSDEDYNLKRPVVILNYASLATIFDDINPV
jgi:hypothetical protein